MNVLIRRLLILFVLLGVVGSAYAFMKPNGKAKKKDEVTYETSPVTTGDVRSFVTATGIVQPHKIVDIKSNVGGLIRQMPIELGDTVKEGQFIMQIDTTDTRAEQDQALADIQSNQARIAQSEATARQQAAQTKARIAAAERGVESAKARLAQAQANLKAQPHLIDAGIRQAKASLVSAEKAVLQAQQSKQQLEASLNNLEKVTIPLNIETVQANVAQAQANLVIAERDYKRLSNLLSQGFVSRAEVDDSYARRANAQAAVRTSKQRLNTLKQENELAVRELKSRISEAASRIEESQARVDQAKAAVAIAEENSFQNDVRKHEYEAAQAAVKQSDADLDAARAEMEAVTARQKEVLAAKAAMVRSKATLARAEINMGFTRITAPRGGVVITKNVEAGTVIASSRGSIGATNALLQIGDISKLWIVCSVDETDIGQVSMHQKVTVRVDAYPSMLIDGKVVRIDPQAKLEQNVTMIPVTVEIAEPDIRFKPGMNATCEFIVDEAEGVLTVPNEALLESDGEYKVRKLVNGEPKEFVVEVGIAGPDTTEIRSGLKEGEEVITRVIEPEKAQTNNPFGSPFGMGGNRNNRGGGGAGGAGGRGGGGAGGRGGGGR